MYNLRLLWEGLKFGFLFLVLGVEGNYILMEEPSEGVNILCRPVKHEAGVYVAVSG